MQEPTEVARDTEAGRRMKLSAFTSYARLRRRELNDGSIEFLTVCLKESCGSEMDHAGVTASRARTLRLRRVKKQNRDIRTMSSTWNGVYENMSLSNDITTINIFRRRRSILPENFSLAIFLMLCILAMVDNVRATDGEDAPWSPRKGCHKVGHRRSISIPNCDRIEVLLNACRGQCLSWAVPSPDAEVTSARFRHKVTSYSHCCRMTEYEEVTYLVKCKEGVRELQFPSALKCECFDCTSHNLK